MEAQVLEFRRPLDPLTAEVVKLMEETDAAGREKALEGIKAVLAFYDRPQPEGRILAFPGPGQ